MCLLIEGLLGTCKMEESAFYLKYLHYNVTPPTTTNNLFLFVTSVFAKVYLYKHRPHRGSQDIGVKSVCLFNVSTFFPLLMDIPEKLVTLGTQDEDKHE
jgi:hypothetical protein